MYIAVASAPDVSATHYPHVVDWMDRVKGFSELEQKRYMYMYVQSCIRTMLPLSPCVPLCGASVLGMYSVHVRYHAHVYVYLWKFTSKHEVTGMCTYHTVR